MSPTVEVCNDRKTWDEYVLGSADASPYHLWAWKEAIEEAFGHSSAYLAAQSGGQLQGVLPLISMKNWLFGHFYVSLPFVNYGGVLASTLQARAALLARAAELARQSGARHVELRQGAESDLNWQHMAAKVAMVVPLSKSAEDLWAGLSSRLRNKVRRAQNHGFTIRWGGLDLVDSFYRVFAPNMRSLGTPVYSRAWFEIVIRKLGESGRILTLFEGDRPVAATVLLVFRNSVELPWIASLTEERKHNSTVLLYWTALEWAAQNGYARVDLGRCTPGGGTYRFKRQWNCREVPLHWYYWLAPGRRLPQLRPDNPRYRPAIWVWQRLPLWVANRLGPRIVRSIP